MIHFSPLRVIDSRGVNDIELMIDYYLTSSCWICIGRFNISRLCIAWSIPIDFYFL